MAIVLDGTNGVTTNSGTLISATTIGVGGATPSTSGAGITFPATQSASSDANTLDDYEEGTWTPVVKLGATTQTTSTPYGTYTKIGRVVYIQFSAESITKSGTGALTVEGLPFTVGPSTFGDIQGNMRWFGIASAGFISGYFNAGNSTILMQNFSSSGYTGTIVNSDCSATYGIYGFEGFYFVS